MSNYYDLSDGATHELDEVRLNIQKDMRSRVARVASISKDVAETLDGTIGLGLPHPICQVEIGGKMYSLHEVSHAIRASVDFFIMEQISRRVEGIAKEEIEVRAAKQPVAQINGNTPADTEEDGE